MHTGDMGIYKMNSTHPNEYTNIKKSYISIKKDAWR